MSLVPRFTARFPPSPFDFFDSYGNPFLTTAPLLMVSCPQMPLCRRSRALTVPKLLETDLALLQIGDFPFKSAFASGH